MDVTDVIDMKETLRAQVIDDTSKVVEAEAAAVVQASAPHGGNGVFLNAKPKAEPHAAPTAPPKGGLRERFLGKRAAASGMPGLPQGQEGPAVPATPAAPAAAAPAAAKAAADKPARAKWFGNRGAKAAAEAAAPVAAEQASVPDAPARPEGPIGPTAKVKTPIVVSRVADKKKPADLPIRVLIGFLAEVSEREAREYAMGVAERNCEQISLVYYDAFKVGTGCAYEIHEGGNGRAYLPEIIKAFNTRGAHRKGAEEDTSVFIPTATRMVQVSRTADGLQAFLLPESTTEVPTTWLQGTTKMSPALPTLVAVLIAGAALFTTGFLALSLALVSRIQPYDVPPTPAIENVNDAFANSPLSRWAALQSVSGNEYVKAVKFAKGKWEIQRASADAEPAPAPMPVPSPDGTLPVPAAPVPVEAAAPAPAIPVTPAN
jgi:hypothetical protein